MNNYSLCTNGDKSTCVQLGNIAGTKYDVAHVKWGGSWRMPEVEQMQELLDNCSFEWNSDEISGFYVVGKTGNCIFLPAAGCRHGGTHQNDGVGIDYWSSEQGTYGVCEAVELTSNHYGNPPYIYRRMSCYLGLYVRPVLK